MIHRGILVAIEDFARRRFRLVFAVTALLVGCSLMLGRWLKLDSDILGFLPASDPEIGRFVRSVRDFGSLDYLLVMLEVPEEESIEDHRAFGDELARRISALPEVDYVEYKLDLHSPAIQLLREHAPLYLDDEGLDRLAAALSDEGIASGVAHLRAALESPMSSFLKQLAPHDPLALTPIYLGRMLGKRGALKVDLSSGVYASSDGRAQLLVVKPLRPPQDIAFSQRLEAAVDRCYDEAKAAIGAGEDPARVPAMKLGGGYIIAIEDAKLVKHDIAFNAICSFVAVTGLYLFCYRRVAAILYSVTPLLVGQALTFGMAVLVLGKLSAISAGFTAMLMGLGTDFTIVMYGRYVEERRAGVSLATATHRMMGETALGVFTGAITSAGTFASVCLSRFPGLRDFGLLVGGGILICMVVILFLLPAMIAWNDGRKELDAVRALYLHSFGVERLLRLADRWPRAVLVTSGVLTLVAGLAAARIQMSDSYKDLRAPNNRGYVVQEEVAKRFGGSFKYIVVVSRGKTVDEALGRSSAVASRLDRWVQSEDVSGYDSLSTYLPDVARQRQVIDRLERGAAGELSAERVTRTLRSELERQGFRTSSFDDGIADLERQLSLRAPLGVEDLRSAGLGKLVDRYAKLVGGEYRVATFVFPRSPRFKDRIPPEFMESVGAGDPSVEITGLTIVGVTVKRLFREDAARAFALGVALVTVLLFFDFRSLRLTIYGMVQLVVGIVWLLGLMQLARIQMNFINAFATTMILGVGIDYGIHLIHRIWEERSLVSTGVMETGKAVVMAALTNVAGFGTVALSSYPGIRSMGLISLFGTLTCLTTSLTLLPALLKVFPERRTAPPPSA
ncbi:MAG: MMPL family transporter [Acidobacteriota bacterium]